MSTSSETNHKSERTDFNVNVLNMTPEEFNKNTSGLLHTVFFKKEALFPTLPVVVQGKSHEKDFETMNCMLSRLMLDHDFTFEDEHLKYSINYLLIKLWQIIGMSMHNATVLKHIPNTIRTKKTDNTIDVDEHVDLFIKIIKMAVIYMFRLQGKLQINRDNFMYTFLMLLILAYKVLIDDSELFQMSDFKVYFKIDLKHFQKMESVILGMLEFRLHISENEFVHVFRNF